MINRDYELCFNKHGCKILDMNENMRMIAIGKKVGRVFQLDALISYERAEAYALYNFENLTLKCGTKELCI